VARHLSALPLIARCESARRGCLDRSASFEATVGVVLEPHRERLRRAVGDCGGTPVRLNLGGRGRRILAGFVDMTDQVPRNARMAERIGATPVRYPFSFLIAGDSGAWPDPTADAIFVQLLRQIADLRPAPVFFAHLGDFAGPGTVARHQHYLELASRLEIPNVCLIGNHDLEDPVAAAAWRAVHGPRNFHFAYDTTRFVAIDGASGQAGDLGDTTPPDTAGPSVEALAYLDETLAATAEPNRVVLLHAPPHLGGHYAPQPECGFRQGEPEFLDIIRRHGVRLVCCAHGLGFDHHIHDGIRFVMSGGGGAALYLSYRNAGLNRGALFHAVEIRLDERGAARGRVLQAFAAPDSPPPFAFAD
jgi:hypothetical protein